MNKESTVYNHTLRSPTEKANMDTVSPANHLAKRAQNKNGTLIKNIRKKERSPH